MKSHRVVAGLLGLGLIGGLAAPSVAYPRPGKTSLASGSAFAVDDCSPLSDTTSDLPGAKGAHDSAISANGRFVAFDSSYCDIVPNDGNDKSDVFYLDRKTGAVEMLSVSPTGTPSEYLPPSAYGSMGPTMSAGGRFVAFVSDADNLTDTSITTGQNVYLRDVREGRTVLVSKIESLPTGVSFANYSSPAVSADGRFVAFIGPASLLGLVDTSPWDDVIVYDRVKDFSYIASVTTAGDQTTAPHPWIAGNRCPSISGDGRFVSFSGAERDLVEDDTNVWADVYVHDAKTGVTERVSLASGNRQANEGTLGTNSCAAGPNEGGGSISSDGRLVTFQSGLSDFVPNDTNESLPGNDGTDVFVHDRDTGRTDRVSVSSYGEEYPAKAGVSPGGGFMPTISPDGRYVAFTGPLDLNDPQPFEPRTTYQGIGVYVYDRKTFDLERINVPRETGDACLSTDGAGGITPGSRFISFTSCFRLATDDGRDLEGSANVYVRDHGASLGGSLSGGRSAAPRLSGLEGFAHRGFASVADGHAVMDPKLEPGSDIIGVDVAHRPSLGDLFFRIQVDHLVGAPGLGALVGGDPLLIHGVAFTYGGRDYELRVSRLGPIARFGLFDCAAGSCRELGSLRGGYGTIGESVAVSLPLDRIGFEGGALKEVSAFSALGTYELGAVYVLDRISLTS